MQDIGNLMRICCDKSGRSGGGVPPGWGGEGGAVLQRVGPVALQEET